MTVVALFFPPKGKYPKFYCQHFFLQVGFPSNLKQFSSIFLYNNLGSRPIWGLRPWQRAGSPPNVGWNLVLGDRRARGTLWINSASEHGCMHARVLNLGFRYGESIETIFISIRLTWRPQTGCRGCRRSRSTSRSEILSQLLSMIETWFWWENQCFWAWRIIWDYFQKPQINLKAMNRVEGL